MGMTADEFLEHHGIKGMRWGVRRAEKARANSDRMQEIARQRPVPVNVVAARRIKKKADRLELHQKRKVKKYGDKTKGRLTMAQKQARAERNIRRVRVGAVVATTVLYAAAQHAAMKNEASIRDWQKQHNSWKQQQSGWRQQAAAPKVVKTVKDIINEERDVKVSSLIRTHKEGHIDKDQLANFLKVLNKRYDRKIFEAGD